MFIVVDSYCIVIHTVKLNNQHHVGVMLLILQWQRTTCGDGLQVEDSQLAGVRHPTERWRSRMVSRPAVPRHPGLRHISAQEGRRAGTTKDFTFDCIYKLNFIRLPTVIHKTRVIINPQRWSRTHIYETPRDIYRRPSQDTIVPYSTIKY